MKPPNPLHLPSSSPFDPFRLQSLGGLAALKSAIAERLDQGELVALEVGRRGLAGLFGRYRDDPTLREICDAAYKERDADVRE